MKKIFLLFSTAFLIVSCTTLKTSTSTSLEVDTSLSSKSTADLEVSGSKISYTYVPERKERKSGMNTVLSNAVSEALKDNGNADVLVHMQYNAVIKKKLWFSKKIRQITVTGYPATYKNFEVGKSK